MATNVLLSTGIDCFFDRFGDENAPALVLLHGLSGNREGYADVVASLTATYGARLQIVNVDMRGHGQSSRASLDRYTAHGYTDDIAALITHLRLAPVLVAGHSLGGVVTASLAVAHPGLVKAVLLEDPPLFEGDAVRRAASPVASFFPTLVAGTSQLHAEHASIEAYEQLAATHSAPNETAARARSLKRWDPTTMQAAIEGIVWQGFSPTAVLPCPVVALRADPNVGAVFSPDDGETFLKANPHATVVEVPGSSHSIHSAATLDAYLAHLTAFVDEHVTNA